MIILAINTSLDKVGPKFHSDALGDLSDAFEETRSQVAIHLKLNQRLQLDGSFEPAAVCEVKFTGPWFTDSKLKREYSEVITHLLHTYGIDPDRVYIYFVRMDPAFVGHKETTIAELVPSSIVRAGGRINRAIARTMNRMLNR